MSTNLSSENTSTNPVIVIENPEVESANTYQAKEAVEETKTKFFSSYDHGITNGILEVNPEDYKRFIEGLEEIQYTEKQINMKQTQVRDLLNEKNKLLQEKEHLQEESIGIRENGVAAEYEVGVLNQRLSIIKEKIKELRKEFDDFNQNYHTDYSLLPAIIFFFFAIVFMAADFGISLNIVADTMKMQGWEGYAFAFGLAGVSVVLKPLYDRIVEKPYVDKNNPRSVKRIFTITIIIVAAIALALLYALGMFRLNVLQIIQGSGEDESFNPFSSKYAVFSFVLSALLFAISGAICLGISIPVFYKQWKLYNLKNLINKFGKLEENILNEIKDKETIRVNMAAQLDSYLQKITNKEEQIGNIKSTDYLQNEINDLLLNLKTAKTNKSIAIYSDGYERGSSLREHMTKEDKLGLVKIESTTPKQLKHDSSDDNGFTFDIPENNKWKKTRPYIAVRKMIAEKFRKRIVEDLNIKIEEDKI